jgi:hypothetical protein
MRRVLTLAALSGLLLLLGCKGGNPMPATVPVKGKVVDAKGGPVTGGKVQFEPKQGLANAMVVSEIGPDGSFSLKTFRTKDQADGAPPGDYVVVVSRKIVDGNNPPPPVTLPGVVTVPAAGNSDLTLKLPAGR